VSGYSRSGLEGQDYEQISGEKRIFTDSQKRAFKVTSRRSLTKQQFVRVSCMGEFSLKNQGSFPAFERFPDALPMY